VSLGEGKSKSDSKNSAALIALKYLLSLDESCFENANFIINRSKKTSNSKQKTSNTKDSGNKRQNSPLVKVDFLLEEEKNQMNFLKKRKNSDENILENEGDNAVRKKLQ